MKNHMSGGDLLVVWGVLVALGLSLLLFFTWNMPSWDAPSRINQMIKILQIQGK